MGKGDWIKGFDLNFSIFIMSDRSKYEGYWREGKKRGKVNYYTAKEKWEEDRHKNSNYKKKLFEISLRYILNFILIFHFYFEKFKTKFMPFIL